MSTQLSEYSWSIMSEIKRQSVKRCLFGLPDPEKLSENLKKQDKIVSDAEIKRFREKWSFDPETGPLQNGRYEYKPMDPLCEIPSFYTKGYSSLKSEPVRLMPDYTCYDGLPNRPAKRKLDLNEQDENNRGNSENLDNLNDCLLNGNDSGIDSPFQSMSSSVSELPEVGDKMCSLLNDSSSPSVGLTMSLSASNLPDFSPVCCIKDNTTPLSKTKPPVQSSMKDYLPSKNSE